MHVKEAISDKKNGGSFMEELAINGGMPVRETPIYYGHQYIDEADIQAVVDVLKSDYLTCGPAIAMLENKLCQITGAKHAVAIANGTAALHAACYAAGIEAGDEVITTPLTFAASANCALYMDAKPVFADVNPETYNIDPDSIEAHITERTRAVVAVDFTGQSVELDRIRDICQRHNLILIEDGAHSLGTLYKGQAVGSIADMTTFSFHPVKTVTGGEGGAIMTNDDELYKRLLLFRSHGITREQSLMDTSDDYMLDAEARDDSLGSWYYQQVDLGLNYRMTDIQAALITSQLDKLESFKHRRAEIVNKYNEAFRDFEGIIVQKEIEESDTARHLYIIQLDLDKISVDRRQIFDALKAENVCCNVHYIPTYLFPYYQKLGYKRGLCPVAEKIYKGIISIPLYPAMTDGDVDSVIEAVKKVVNYYRK